MKYFAIGILTIAIGAVALCATAGAQTTGQLEASIARAVDNTQLAQSDDAPAVRFRFNRNAAWFLAGVGAGAGNVWRCTAEGFGDDFRGFCHGDDIMGEDGKVAGSAQRHAVNFATGFASVAVTRLVGRLLFD